jgi:hypothetical protein
MGLANLSGNLKCVKQIVGTGGGVFQVHRACNVDPHPSDVNKAGTSKGT